MALRSIKHTTRPAAPDRFATGDRVWGPFIFFDSGEVVGVGAPNRYGYRMLDVRSDAGTVIGILEVWPSATREEATERHTERYGHPPDWRDDDAGLDWADLAAAGD